MEISVADQIALDDALVAPANRLKIGKCNLRLTSDVISKEATLQVVYDVLKLTLFYKAFHVSADVPEIYMQELWASAYIHNRSVRFKMNNKKYILDLDQFRDILQIFPKVEFDEERLSTEEKVSTDKEGVSTDFEKVSTDRPKVSTDDDESNESTEEIFEGTEDQREGTEDKVSTDEQMEGIEDQSKEENASKSSQTSTQTPTSMTFGDDETIATLLINM
ncbi:hypothetical protein Tco_1472717, partial [Tanacetum coccineum]